MLCPVCGYELNFSVWEGTTLTKKSCPSCGSDFGDEFFQGHLIAGDAQRNQMFFRIARGWWSEAHLPWRGKDIQKPPDWDPIEQLHQIGIDWGSSFAEWLDNNPIISPENNEKFLQIALRKLATLDWKPEVIEAVWDGDTQGWMLELIVSANRPSEDNQPFTDYYLFWLRAGGDLRIFNGYVPPWPEAQVGMFVGEGLSQQLGIPFYFPSPDEPDDDCPRWRERDRAHPCVSCGKLIICESKICYPCELKKRFGGA
ncbi:MAG: hypothetical protein ABI947_07420 [Chloroflexota bacterium]